MELGAFHASWATSRPSRAASANENVTNNIPRDKPEKRPLYGGCPVRSGATSFCVIIVVSDIRRDEFNAIIVVQ